MQAQENTPTEQLKNYLRGYVSYGHNAMALMQQVKSWQALAAAEIERRAALFMQMFDEAVLIEIAEGRIDVPAVCEAVANEMTATDKYPPYHPALGGAR